MPALQAFAVPQQEGTIRPNAADSPHPPVAGVPNAISPQQPFHLRKTPTAVSSAIHAAIEREQNLPTPPAGISTSQSWQLMQCQRTWRNAITDVEAKPDPELTNLGSTLNHTRQKTSQLPRPNQEIIGPFDPHRQSTGFKPFRDRNRYRQSEQPGASPTGLHPWKYGADPEATCRRGPRAAPLTKCMTLARGNDSAGTSQLRMTLDPACQNVFGARADRKGTQSPRTSLRTCRAPVAMKKGGSTTTATQWISGGEHH